MAPKRFRVRDRQIFSGFVNLQLRFSAQSLELLSELILVIHYAAVVALRNCISVKSSSTYAQVLLWFSIDLTKVQ